MDRWGLWPAWRPLFAFAHFWEYALFYGALQFPLTTIGNGFADNHKQLFGFLLCHDLLLALGVPVALLNLKKAKIC